MNERGAERAAFGPRSARAAERYLCRLAPDPLRRETLIDDERGAERAAFGLRTEELVAREEIVVQVHGAAAGADEGLAFLDALDHFARKLRAQIRHDRGRARAGGPRRHVDRD